MSPSAPASMQTSEAQLFAGPGRCCGRCPRFWRPQAGQGTGGGRDQHHGDRGLGHLRHDGPRQQGALQTASTMATIYRSPMA